LKRTLLLSFLAVIPAALMPLAATCQVTPTAGSAPAERVEPTYKYEAFAGYGYTSLNQVNQSRNGLQGVNLAITRNWGKYFGLTADGGFYKFTYDSKNPGTPTVSTVLFGPVLHAPLYGRVDGFFHVLLGGEHTAGESMTPKVSFAGGVGVGMDYRLSQRIALRASGDDIASSFVQDPNHLGYSPHKRWNSRAALGVVYKF
jgi:hypothetical protein